MIVNSTITLDRHELSEKEWTRLFKALTFKDSDQVEWKSYKLLGGGKVRIHRGAWNLLPDHVRYVDRRVCPPRRKLVFTPTLDSEGRTGQMEALQAILKEEQGLVVAQPGFGKTVVALAAVAAVRTEWLVLVHTEDIFNQWVDYAKASFEDIEVGRIQGQAWTLGDITIAMVQTIRDQMPRFRRHYADNFGGVIADEGHHSPAETWEIILANCPAKYRLGFTATETRADGRQALMKHLIGPVIFKQKFELKVPTKVIPLRTEFKVPYRGHYDWMPMLDKLTKDESRNQLIAETAVRQLQKGHSVLILSRRLNHLDNIKNEMLFKWVGQGHIFQEQVAILTGKTPRAKRMTMLRDFRKGKIKCLLSTQLADEALDVPILSRVFLTFPGKHDGRLIQQVGRALREHDDKTNAVIFDVVDEKISVLHKQWKQRKMTYSKLKIPIQKKKGEKEDRYVSQAEKRRNVAHRVRARLAEGRRANRGKGSRSR